MSLSMLSHRVGQRLRIAAALLLWLGGSATGAQGQTTEKTAGETYKNVKVLTSVSA